MVAALIEREACCNPTTFSGGSKQAIKLGLDSAFGTPAPYTGETPPFKGGVLQITSWTDPLEAHLSQLQRDFSALFEDKSLAKDAQFLRRVAITIKHLHYDAMRNPMTDEVQTFLTTSLGDFQVSEMTLLDAADSYSEQDPKHSDLSELLSEIATFGPLFIRLPLSGGDPSMLYR